MATRRRFINVVNENKKTLLEDNYYDNEEIISLINKLMMYYHDDLSEKNFHTEYDEIKYYYIKEISNIHLSKTRGQVLEIYNNLVLYSNRYLRRLKRLPKKINFEICIQLEENISFIKKLINEEYTSEYSKRKLIDKLNNVIKLIEEDNYDMLISHA